MEDHEEMRIESIGNYYGGLYLKRENSQDFWSIENWDGHHWERIPDYLGNALRKYEKEEELGEY